MFDACNHKYLQIDVYVLRVLELRIYYIDHRSRETSLNISIYFLIHQQSLIRFLVMLK